MPNAAEIPFEEFPKVKLLVALNLNVTRSEGIRTCTCKLVLSIIALGENLAGGNLFGNSIQNDSNQ